MTRCVKIFCVVFLFVMVSEVCSQAVTWQREYPQPFNVEGSTVTQTTDSCYFMSGQTKFNPRKFSVLKVDGSGDTIWSKLFTGEYCANIFQISDGNFIMVGNENEFSFAYKISALGNIIWYKRYYVNSFSGLVAGFEFDNGNLIFFGISSLNNRMVSNYISLKTDYNGDSLSLNYIHNSNGIGNVINYRNNRILLTGSRLSASQAVIANLDGNFVRSSESYFKTGTVGANNFYFVRDSVTQTSRTLIINKTDTNFKILLTREISITGEYLKPYNVTSSNTGIVICGYSTNNVNSNPSSFLLKTDFDINLLWYKNYELPNRFYYFSNVTQTNDKGYFAAGSIGLISDGGVSYLYAAKTDSNGNIFTTKISNPQMTVIKQNDLFQNYPNPFNSETIIKFTISGNSYIKLKIFNSLGQLLKTEINKYLSSGSYLHRFSTPNDFSSGVYFYSLGVFDFKKEYMIYKKMVLIR